MQRQQGYNILSSHPRQMEKERMQYSYYDGGGQKQCLSICADEIKQKTLIRSLKNRLLAGLSSKR